MRISVRDAQENLGELIDRADKEEDILLTRGGDPIARIVPLKAVARPAKSREELIALFGDIKERAPRPADPFPDETAARSHDFCMTNMACRSDRHRHLSSHGNPTRRSTWNKHLACEKAIERTTRRYMSTATITECLIVASRRRLTGPMQNLLSIARTETIDLTQARAERAADAYQQFGKNVHPASLNFDDRFSYATAKAFDCPFLAVGNDFTRTDVRSALSPV